jgi:hypothetical protein
VQEEMQQAELDARRAHNPFILQLGFCTFAVCLSHRVQPGNFSFGNYYNFFLCPRCLCAVQNTQEYKLGYELVEGRPKS